MAGGRLVRPGLQSRVESMLLPSGFVGSICMLSEKEPSESPRRCGLDYGWMVDRRA